MGARETRWWLKAVLRRKTASEAQSCLSGIGLRPKLMKLIAKLSERVRPLVILWVPSD